MAARKNPAHDALVERVDWALVGAEIDKVKLLADDRAVAVDLILRAMRRWTVRDQEEYAVDGTERYFLVDRHGADVTSREPQSHDTHGYVDVTGVVGGGVRKLVDWKTAGSVDAVWRERCRLSWQWSIYCYAEHATVFSFRGLTRSGQLAEVLLTYPTEQRNDAAVKRRLLALHALRDQQAENGTPWLRNEPFACGAFGRACPHRERCDGGGLVPPAPQPVDGPLSHSGAQTLLLCPERYRLDRVYREDDDTEESNLGSAFHVGIANVYQQLWGLA